ncbi:PIN domain-containing protein [Amycolatopsis japonica]|uniref:PIN domain-containing protein n=1 Tax=Amycolatopsis japonica TaxID=208439 RepID=UPI0033D0A44A
MLVTPRPGIDRNNLLNALRDVRDKAFTLRGGSVGGNAYEWLLAYLSWASDAVSALGQQISSADLDRLVLTTRYEQLLSGVGTLAGTHTTRLVNLLVSQELQQRVDAFEEAVLTLQQHINRWSQSDYFVVADSSFYIKHPDKLEAVDLAKVVDFHDGPIHLLFPMAVVDELDRLKESKDRHLRWRAGYTLAVLDRLFQGGAETARLREADRDVQRTTGIRRGEVNVEILFDPPEHVRLPISDDEIVDRAAAVQPLVRRQVVLLTYDTGQSSRGRKAGLKVVKLSRVVEEESEPAHRAQTKVK